MTWNRNVFSVCAFTRAMSKREAQPLSKEGEIGSVSTGYFLHDGVLMRKWTPPHVSSLDDWSVVKQVVVPCPFRSEVPTLAHDNPLAGHLGIQKMYDQVLRCFFWPG